MLLHLQKDNIAYSPVNVAILHDVVNYAQKDTKERSSDSGFRPETKLLVVARKQDRVRLFADLFAMRWSYRQTR